MAVHALLAAPALWSEEPRALAVANAGFEEGMPGTLPPRWLLGDSQAGVSLTATSSDREPFAGKHSVRLARKGPAGIPSILYQEVPVAGLRGRRLRLQAAIRSAQAGDGWVRLFLQIDLPGKDPRVLVSDDASATWRADEVYADVAANAERIRFGLMVAGPAEGSMDAVSLADIGPAGEGNEPPRPLSARGRANLLAYLHLLGVLRYFHPSDQAASLNWERFVIATVGEVESARDPAGLARTFSRIFSPVAPTARFFATGQAPPRSPLPKSAEARVVAWVHHGLETPAARSHAHFSSRRMGGYLPESPPEPADLPLPEEPVELDLGGGVSARVPVALYRDEGGSLPHQGQAPDPFPAKKPKGFEPSGDDRATRLADVLLLGAALESFYPYADGGARFLEQLPGALPAAAEDPDARRFLDTLRGLTHALGDGHAEVAHWLDARRFRMPLLWTSLGDSLVITWVAPGLAGIRPGDVVLAIDGRRASAAVAAAESLVSGASAGHLRFQALEFLASGDHEEERQLRIERGGRTFEVTLRCSVHAFGAQRPRRPSPGAVSEVGPGLWYIDLERIDDKGFQNALPQLAKAKGIVFDLRGYPERISPVLVLGHLLAGQVTDKTRIEVRTRPDRPGRFDLGQNLLKPAGERLQAKIVFLTDERAVSLAEAFLQVVDDHQLAVIVGAPTAGTRGEIDEMVLPGSYDVRWTGSQALRADGTPYRGVGVIPSIRVQPTLVRIAEQRDEVLEAAIAELARNDP